MGGAERPPFGFAVDAARGAARAARFATPHGTVETPAFMAVGTTSVRTLESAADADGRVRPGSGDTALFIRPPYRARAVDRVVTNFHLPKSTLVMLVAAFAGYELTMHAYQEAVREGYRFYSYGDAMVIL